ncbi:MAG: ABC transporter substrate-binding protein [bacterium]|nr:ABC transporter substrate-binding protein [bacterium]
MFKISLISLLIGIFLVSSSLSSIGQAQSKIKIVFWTTLPTGGYLSRWIKEFESQYPNIQVEQQFISNSYDEMAEKVLASIAGKATPNVAQVGQRHGIPQYVDSGALLPAGSMLDKNDISDILPGLWSRYTYKGRFWAVPFASSTPGLWYNKNLFRRAGLNPNRAPKNWEELVSFAKRLTSDTNGDGKIDQWGIGFSEDVPWYYRPMVIQNGGVIFDKNTGKPMINSKESIETLQFFQDLVFKYRVMPPLQHNSSARDFVNGLYGMLYRSTSVRVSLKKEVGDRFELGLGFLPGKKRVAVGVGGNALVLFKSTPEKEDASLKLIKFLTDTRRTVEMGLETGYVAVRKSAQKQSEIINLRKNDPIADTIYKQIDYIKDSGINPGDALFWRGILRGIEEVETSPDISPKMILDNLQQEILEFLNNYGRR